MHDDGGAKRPSLPSRTTSGERGEKRPPPSAYLYKCLFYSDGCTSVRRMNYKLYSNRGCCSYYSCNNNHYRHFYPNLSYKCCPHVLPPQPLYILHHCLLLPLQPTTTIILLPVVPVLYNTQRLCILSCLPLPLPTRPLNLHQIIN